MPGVFRRNLNCTEMPPYPLQQHKTHTVVEEFIYSLKLCYDILTIAILTIVRVEHRNKRDQTTINDHFALVREIHRHPFTDAGLHLSDPPVRSIRMADKHPRFQK